MMNMPKPHLLVGPHVVITGVLHAFFAQLSLCVRQQISSGTTVPCWVEASEIRQQLLN